MAAALDLIQIKADRRRSENKIWGKWMQSAAEIAGRFHEELEDDPFMYGEQASVGFLTAAASHAGYLALPEFAVQKIAANDRRKRARGRADLWIFANQRNWWFEAKQHFISRGSDRDLDRKWQAAVSCAKAVKINGVSVAMLIVSCWWVKNNRLEKLLDARAALERFGKDRQFAWRLGGENDDGPETYIFMDIERT